MLDISCMESFIMRNGLNISAWHKKEGELDVIGISKITNVMVSKEQLFTLSSSKVTTK